MPTMLRATFNFAGYRITAEAPPEWQFILTPPADAPLFIDHLLLIAASEWCANRDDYRASLAGRRIYLAFPLSQNRDDREFDDFLERVQQILVAPPLRRVTGGLLGSPLFPMTGHLLLDDHNVVLLSVPASVERSYETILVYTDAPPAFAAELFLRASHWCIAFTERDASMGLRCIRENDVISVMALPRAIFTQQLMEKLGNGLANPLPMCSAAAAAGTPDPGALNHSGLLSDAETAQLIAPTASAAPMPFPTEPEPSAPPRPVIVKEDEEAEPVPVGG